ncbi:MAG: SRPBCC family protein [Woeseiaceae bacterium]
MPLQAQRLGIASIGYRQRLLGASPGLLLLLFAQVTEPADLRTVEVEREDNRYSMTSRAYFAASRQDLYRVLTDYSLFQQFSSTYVESRNVAADEQGRPRFFTRMQGCVLLFCRSFVRHGYLLLAPPSEIVAIAEPAESDFAYSRERWRLEREGDGTLLIYDFEMEPGFWVPPVIGPYVIQRSLRAGGGDAIDRIEALALGRTPIP